MFFSFFETFLSFCFRFVGWEGVPPTCKLGGLSLPSLSSSAPLWLGRLPSLLGWLPIFGWAVFPSPSWLGRIHPPSLLERKENKEKRKETEKKEKEKEKKNRKKKTQGKKGKNKRRKHELLLKVADSATYKSAQTPKDHLTLLVADQDDIGRCESTWASTSRDSCQNKLPSPKNLGLHLSRMATVPENNRELLFLVTLAVRLHLRKR